MNEIEAIEILKKALRNIAVLSRINSKSVDVDMLISLHLAIKALQEKAEREKGCEYCLNQKKITDTNLVGGFPPNQDTEIVSWIYKDNLIYNVVINGKSSFCREKIMYCPKCGRGLEGK